MTGDWTLMLACNDYRNGAFTGRFEQAHVLPPGGIEGGIEVDGLDMVCRFGVGLVQLGRRRYPIWGHTEWYGNWCWDAVRVSRETAERVLEHFREHGGNCHCGPAEVFEAWRAGAPLLLTGGDP